MSNLDFLSGLFKMNHDLHYSAENKSYRRGQFIYRAGESADGVYLLEEGLVGLSIEGPSGKVHLMRFFRPGQIFGHRSLLAEEPYHASTQVLDDSSLLFVKKATILDVFEKHPHVYQLVVKQLALELHQCEMQQVNVLDKQVMPRVAQAIVYLKELHPDYRWTRSELSAFCGSTTATVIKALAELEYMGFIKQRGRDIQILNRQALIQLT